MYKLLHDGTTRRKWAQNTFAVELALLRGALALVEVLVAHLRGHWDALSGGLGDVLGHPQPPSDDVPQERHLDYVPSMDRYLTATVGTPPSIVSRSRQKQQFLFSAPILGCSANTRQQAYVRKWREKFRFEWGGGGVRRW